MRFRTFGPTIGYFTQYTTTPGVSEAHYVALGADSAYYNNARSQSYSVSGLHGRPNATLLQQRPSSSLQRYLFPRVPLSASSCPPPTSTPAAVSRTKAAYSKRYVFPGRRSQQKPTPRQGIGIGLAQRHPCLSARLSHIHVLETQCL